MDLINYFKETGYDWLPLPTGDGVTDDTKAIQNRINSGLDPFKIGGNHLIKGTIDMRSKITMKGKK